MLPKALLFDMDGTLTAPLLDFPRLKAEMGIGDRPILEALADMPAEQRRVAEGVLHRYEDEAATASTLNAGCDVLLHWAASHRLGTALITRNRRQSVQTVLARHGLSLDVLITREDGPAKPDPHPLLRACQTLRVAPADAWMIGDGQYDVEAGVAAGIQTVWLSHGRLKPFAAEPWRTVRDLQELLALLRAAE